MKAKIIMAAAGLMIFGPFCFCFGQVSGASSAQAPDNVMTIIKQSCAVTGCHAGKYPASGHSYEPDKFAASVVDAPSLEAPGLKIVDTAAPEKSYLLAKIKGKPGIVGKRMPADRDPLTDDQIRQIEDWIKSLAQGGSTGEILFNPGYPDGGPALAGPPVREEGSGQASPSTAFSRPAFWGTRLVNLPTTTTLGKGEFLFRVSHRFQPPMSDGWDAFYGLDGPAYVLLSFGYGLRDDLMVTVGRTGLFQEWELSADWALVEQGARSELPFSATLHAGASIVSMDKPEGDEWSGRLRLSALLSLSYQFDDRLSFLLVPAFASNTNFWDPDSEGTFALGIGARYTVFDEISLIAEWVPPLAGYNDLYSGWGFGVEKKIGGHVFQVFVTDSIGLLATQYLPGGDLRLGDGDFRIGFNIFRIF
jgi:hypothetical protein